MYTKQLAQLTEAASKIMKSTSVAVLVLLLATLATANHLPVCCENVGCFCNTKPWRTPERPVPPPDCAALPTIRSLLYRRESVDAVETTLDSTIDIHLPSYDNQRPTYYIIAGYDSNSIHLYHLKDAILSREDAYVFIITWGITTGWSYLQAAANTRVVGAQLRRLVNFLQEQYSADPKNMECLGAGLGAHICGYAGKVIKLRGITGLDATAPLFEGEGPQVRLWTGDADFVVAIHTDAKSLCQKTGLGMIDPIGDVDFYINGGMDQPGCPKFKRPVVKTVCELKGDKLQDVFHYTVCPHTRAIEVYTDAVKNPDCIMWGHKLKIFGREITDSRQINPPKFHKCKKNTCSPVGLDTSKFPGRKSFYVPTSNRSPYCIPEPIAQH